jgi:hypothetical protein
MVNREVFNTVLVHTARTWERLRLEQPYQEMPIDNIGSVDAIIEISEEIMKDYHIEKFIDSPEADYFMTHTGMLSDTYIETLGEEIIKKQYELSN